MLKLDAVIDTINEKVGFLFSYLILPLIAVIGWEVIMRYGFNSPTSWAFELTVFIYGIHFSFALAYAHKHDTHVAIDVFESRLPPKPRLVLRICTNLIFFIPAMGLLTYYTGILAINSWQQLELSSSSWSPPLYPFKTLMAIAFLLFFLQGIAKLIKDIRSLKEIH